MQVNGREHQTHVVSTGESVVSPKIKNRGPCPVCKKYLPQLKLGPFIKHRQQCKVDISQREVSCSSPDRSSPPNPHSFCSTAFRQTANPKVRLPVRKDKKPHKCSLCDKKFAQRGNMLRHQRIHTGEKPFKCKKCNKCFTRAYALAKHQSIHSGEKPYKCKQCNKAFSQKNYLSVHQRVHTGEKPYKCKQCNKAFSRKHSLLGIPEAFGH